MNKKYKHKIVWVENNQPDQTVEKLRLFGDDGWRLAACLPTGHPMTTYLIFEKEETCQKKQIK